MISCARARALFTLAAKIAAGASIGPAERCACCGRRLTDPESQARGIGPECIGKLDRLVGWVRGAGDRVGGLSGDLTARSCPTTGAVAVEAGEVREFVPPATFDGLVAESRVVNVVDMNGGRAVFGPWTCGCGPVCEFAAALEKIIGR